ncbi:MAG: GMP/IMP nucleotidase [Arenicella sp.]
MIIDWQKIDTVMLDMDGTLLDLHFDNYFWCDYLPGVYAKTHSLDLQQSRDHLFPKLAAKRGQLEWYCVDYWSDELGIDIPALKAEVRHKIRFRPQAEQFLQQLGAMNKQVWLVTNAHRKVLSLKLEAVSMQEHFHELISSHDFGYPKEQQQFWQQLNAKHAFEPARTLFIDDSLPVLRSARQYGIGYLRAIELPDLLADSKDTEEFTAINQFSETY